MVFDEAGIAIAKGSEPLHTSYLDNGFVEQDAEEIYQNVLTSVKKCLQQFKEKGHDVNNIAAIGISNQRETFVIWDKNGKPLHPAIVWQCKRSVQICEDLKSKTISVVETGHALSPEPGTKSIEEKGHALSLPMADLIQQKTGLIIDPYFSATKLIWLFRNDKKIRTSIEKGEAYFGTIDTWLLYKLTNGVEYATDYTNASRTLFFNLHTLEWDDELINQFGLTGINLPQLKSSSSLFGETTLNNILPKAIPVTAIIGDSHAAAFGEGCFDSGSAKATLGTGCSILMNIGDKPVASKNGMVTTICWSMEDRIDYALEGVIVSCGATIEWLKNELNLFNDSKQTEAMANAVADAGGVYLIPAFSGLGSPHWQMERRASLSGINFSTTKNHIVRAALESIPYQIADVIAAMEKDTNILLKELMVNGGMTSNRFVLQLLTDLLNKPVATAGMPDVSALGAAYLAGLHAGVHKNIDSLRQLNQDRTTYKPGNGTTTFNKNYEGWKNIIKNYVSS